MMPPLGLLKHRADIARPTLTGTGVTTVTVASAVPCLVTVKTSTMMLPEGPLVRAVVRARFRPGADIARGDTLTVDGDTVEVQEVAAHCGPNGRHAWTEVAAW